MKRWLWLEYDDSTSGPMVVLLTDLTGEWLTVEGTESLVDTPRYQYVRRNGRAAFTRTGSECRWLDLRGQDHNPAMAAGGDHLWEMAT